ncbi:MAG: hypothetical protein ACTSSR_00515 [Alphaproteobacteria bacterium]
MGVALTLQQHLDDQGIEYDVMMHKKPGSTSGTADAGAPGRCLVGWGILTSPDHVGPFVRRRKYQVHRRI